MNKIFCSFFTLFTILSGVSCSHPKPTPSYAVNLNIPKNYYYLNEKKLSIDVYVWSSQHIHLFEKPGKYIIAEVINEEEIIISSGEVDYSGLQVKNNYNFKLNLNKNDLLNESGMLVVTITNNTHNSYVDDMVMCKERIQYDIKYNLTSFCSVK